MGKTFDQGKNDVAKLCRYFETNRSMFLAPSVKEAHVRQTLIDPFFMALGWDVHNESQTAPQYREVIPEDSQRQIHATDAEIDRLVYGHYGLTDDEIKIVDEGTK